MIKIKDDIRELSVHILQNPEKENAILINLLNEQRKEYHVLIELDKYSLVKVRYTRHTHRPWDAILPENSWVAIDYEHRD